ncbi:transposase [Streptosporangium sp. NPDC006007]|uniref:transposase n=1 Tax=Streptosporangium sp. NPDC006007 TaxID=3154575 RepID=UPI0033ACA91A
MGGDGGEGAKFWLHVLAETKNRGFIDALTVVRDGLKGLPQAIEQVWSRAVVRTCAVRLSRAFLRYAARRHRGAVTKAP